MTWLHKLRDSYRRMHPFARYGTKAEVTGGVILILLGLKILLEHLGVW